MAPTKNDHEQSDTQSAPIEKADKVPTAPPMRSKTDTGTPSPQTERTVPSSTTTGSVWLRYSVSDSGAGSCESSTET